MRKRNAMLNMIFGIVYQIMAFAISFILRTIVVKTFDAEYIGLISVFAELIGIMVALDGGICGVLFIKLHIPLAEGDENRIRDYFRVIRWVYTIRAFLVFCVGSILCFLLPVIIGESALEMGYIRISFMVYLAVNTVYYCFVFYTNVLEALQKQYLASIIQIFAHFFIGAINIFLVISYHNFLVYLIVSNLSTVIVGVVAQFVVFHQMPFLRNKTERKIPRLKEELVGMFGMGLHGLSSVIVKYTDSIFITRFAGLGMTGLYGNYKTLINAVYRFVEQIVGSIKDPMRNLIVKEEKQKVIVAIDNLTFLFFCVAGFCSNCLITLLTPFVKIWLGDNFIINDMAIFWTVIALFLSVVNNPMLNAYYCRDCYKRDKRTPIIEITINVVVSVIFGIQYGIAGVMFGTVCYYFYQTIKRAYRLYKEVFNEDVMRYLSKVMGYLGVTLISICLTQVFHSFVYNSNIILDFVIKCTGAFLIPIIIIYVLYRRTEQFQYFKDVAWNLVEKKKLIKCDKRFKRKNEN